MTSSLFNLEKNKFNSGEIMKTQTKAQKFLSLLTAYFIRVKLFVDFLNLYKNLDGIIVALLIPKDHLLIRVMKKINFDFVNELCKPYYKHSGPGRHPITPVKVFKMLLVLVLYGLLSERELIRQIQVNVAFRYFCGFRLFDKIPDHSTLTVFRQRIGKAPFKAIFVQILELCLKHKLVTNEMYIFDATVVKAHSSKLPPNEQALRLYRAVIRTLFGGDDPQDDQKATIAEAVLTKIYPNKKFSDEDKQRKLTVLTDSDIHTIALDEDARRTALTPNNPSEIVAKKSKLADFIELLYDTIPHGVRDTSARLLKMKTTILGYLLYIGIDRTHLVITSFDFDTANVKAHEKFLSVYDDHLYQTQFRLRNQRPYPRSVSCDSELDVDIAIRSACGTDDGVQCNIPVRDIGINTGLFSPSAFVLDDEDTLHCPAHKPMTRTSSRKSGTDKAVTFQGVDCPTCPLKAQCTPANCRTVTIHIQDHRLRQRAREYNTSDQYKSAMIDRLQIEGVFGLGKMYRHLERCYYFDKEQNYNYAALFCTAHNLLKLVLHT